MEEGGREIIKAHPTGYKFPTRSHTAMGEKGEGTENKSNWLQDYSVVLQGATS